MSGVGDRWPIVGRRPQLARFEAAFRSETVEGVLIHGPAGVGKTRLADECRTDADARGHPTERIVGSVTAAAIPLGAVAPLLGSAGLVGEVSTILADPVRLFEDVVQHIAEHSDGRRLVTVVDDIHLLDDASLTLLSYLLARSAIFLVGTVRTGEPVPDLLTGLWRDDRVERIDLDALSRESVDTLLHLVLGAPMEVGAALRLWSVSRGNPLYLRELVLGALDAGALVDRSGVWHLDGPVPSSERLVDLVELRLRTLGPEARSVMDLLSLCEPLELADLEPTASTAVLEALERSGLVDASHEQGRIQVRLAHPLHGEVLRSELPEMRKGEMLRAQVARLEARGLRGPDDQLRCARWRLESGDEADPTLLERAAHIARYAHDFRLVERLLRAVPPARRTIEARLLLGEVLYELGSFTEAEAVLSEAQSLARTEEQTLLLVTTRSKNLQFGLCDSERALQVNNEAAAKITGPELRRELEADEAGIRLFAGRPREAIEVLDRMTVGDQRTRVVRAITLAPALAVVGRTLAAVAVAETGFADHVSLGEELAIAHPGTHIVNQVFALADCGRLADAERLALAAAEIAAKDRVPIAQIWFAINLGRIAALQGRLLTGRNRFVEGAGLAEVHGFAGPQRMALSGVACLSAMLGDLATARDALARRDGLPKFAFLGPEQLLADAWVAVTDGRRSEAIAMFDAAAGDARATCHVTAESWLLHDRLRVAGPDGTARLSELAAASESPLLAARARHADAVVAGDPELLAAAGHDFESLGALLVAAEAYTSAVDAFRRRGDQRAATASANRARTLALACEGAHTPGLAKTDAVVPLSRRERDVALLAGRGLSSKDIASQLFLSVRTVDNHLQRAYTKLGVSSRSELAEALDATP
jgi:DNA-binding CsgD family transcriptional regulator/DNA-binding transcriptional ArsR family regulator